MKGTSQKLQFIYHKNQFNDLSSYSASFAKKKSWLVGQAYGIEEIKFLESRIKKYEKSLVKNES